MIPLIDGPQEPYDIIAVQEPWLNPFVATTYCPRDCPYNLIFCKEGRARTSLYINKNIPLDKWQAGCEPDYSWVKLETGLGLITVHNIYSEIPETHETITWNTPIPHMLEAIRKPGQHIIVGDFNLHHPFWGGRSVSQAYAGADALLCQLRTGNLDLLLQPGTITREKHGNMPSTLDLSMCTAGLTPRVVKCKVTDEFCGSDHLPIETEFLIGNTVRKDPKPHWNFQKTNLEAVTDGAKWLMPLAGAEHATQLQIDIYTQYLTSFIKALIQETVPQSKQTRSSYSKPWWNQEVADAVTGERRARRAWSRTHSNQDWEEFLSATSVKKQCIASAKQAYWRKSVHEASISKEGIWKLAKWARTKSHLPPDPPQMPDILWQEQLHTTTESKARALYERFYPIVAAETDDIRDQELQEPYQELAINSEVLTDEVRSILQAVKPDKCPGIDEIPNRFLKAMGDPFVKAIQSLITAVIKTSYFPICFRTARTIVLRKPGRPSYADPGAWRPIALLSTIGKIIETIAARRLSALAEQNSLLPDTQMGNRKDRSTDTALDLLLEQIHTVWQAKDQVATVLSLDIAGAFDTVNHLRLLDNLRKKQVPLWFVRLIKSFLTDRETTLVVDGVETAARKLKAGVPQGSPLSPILFLFYSAPLLESLNQPDAPLAPIGFADDVNLLTYGPSTAVNCQNLQIGHAKCLDWARTHGMRFAPTKYTLTHFTRRKAFDLQAPIVLPEVTVHPEPTVKILGLILDTKLRWKAQERAIQEKMRTQMLALQRTTASTWGATMLKARQVYQAVIRPAIAYGAPVWHQLADKPKGIAIKLRTEQNKGLRTVLGAFKATPVRQLETEAYIPPIDLWLNGKVARYQARVEQNGTAEVIQGACNVIREKQRQKQRQKRSRRHVERQPIAPTPGYKRREWAVKWTDGPIKDWDCREKQLVERDWLKRWRSVKQVLRPGTDPGGGIVIQENTEPTKRILGLHKELQKAESSLLVQCRTGRIGLARFLYGQGVPGVQTAQCQCHRGEETPRHMALFCEIETDRKRQLTDTYGRSQSYSQLVGTPKAAKIFVKWMMYSGRLGQFALAKRLLFHSE